MRELHKRVFRPIALSERRIDAGKRGGEIDERRAKPKTKTENKQRQNARADDEARERANDDDPFD